MKEEMLANFAIAKAVESVKVTDEEALKKLALFFDALDEDDDVQNVWNNLENTEDLPEL